VKDRKFDAPSPTSSSSTSWRREKAQSAAPRAPGDVAAQENGRRVCACMRQRAPFTALPDGDPRRMRYTLASHPSIRHGTRDSLPSRPDGAWRRCATLLIRDTDRVRGYCNFIVGRSRLGLLPSARRELRRSAPPPLRVRVSDRRDRQGQLRRSDRGKREAPGRAYSVGDPPPIRALPTGAMLFASDTSRDAHRSKSVSGT